MTAPTGAPAATGRWDGARLLDSVDEVCAAVQSGDWAGGLLATAGAAGEAVEFVQDPLSALVATGLGWLLEHVPQFRQALDDLAGDRTAIAALTATWRQVADDARHGAEELRRVIHADTAPWHGPAVEAYRPVALGLAEAAAAGAAAARVAGQAVAIAGDLVLAARAVVRDLIAKAVADVIATFTRTAVAVTAGPAGVAGVALLLVERAVAWAVRVVAWVGRVGEALGRLRVLLGRLAPALACVPGVRVPSSAPRFGVTPSSRPVAALLDDVPPPSPGATAYAFAVEAGKQHHDPGPG